VDFSVAVYHYCFTVWTVFAESLHSDVFFRGESDNSTIFLIVSCMLAAPEKVSIEISLTEYTLRPELLGVFESEIKNYLVQTLLKI
jgi:hypothetical protein